MDVLIFSFSTELAFVLFYFQRTLFCLVVVTFIDGFREEPAAIKGRRSRGAAPKVSGSLICILPLFNSIYCAIDSHYVKSHAPD